MATRAEPFARDRAWHTALSSAFTTVDHKAIGLRFMVTAFLFFCMAGIEVLFIRLQLSRAENTLLSADVYSQFFTMHGTTMVFFFSTPVLFGFGSYLIPLMTGAPNMAFPRLNAFGYWVFLFSGLFMYSSFLFGMAPNGGWLAYSPLNSGQYSPGLNLDFWSLGLIFLSIAFSAEAINFIVTILKKRAPGLSLNHMPLFAWAVLVTSFVVILAALTLMVANALLMMERRLGYQFFHNGASPFLWQHLFWVFGFPEVFIIMLPVIGIVSEVINTFARRPVLGYALLVRILLAAGIIGIVIWIVHLLTAVISVINLDFLGLDSYLLAIPAGILIFTWLAMLVSGRPVWTVPLMWIGGFIFLLVFGGLASLMLATAPYARQLSGTTFDVARLHDLLAGGALFPMLAGLYYWFPKFFDRMLNDRLGKIHFWLFFIGLNLTFIPLYILGLEGMPRRDYAYLSGTGWDGLNLVATIGGVMIAEGVLVFIVNLIISLTRGEPAGENPWDSNSPEWAEPSEPLQTPRKLEDIQNSLAPFLLAASLLVIFIGVLLSQTWLEVGGGVLAVMMLAIWRWSSRTIHKA